MVLVTVLYGFGYIAYATYGLQDVPSKKYYNKLLHFRVALRDFIICSAVAIWGYVRIQSGITNETFVFAPIIFIPSLLLANSIVKVTTKRNIIIATRWDAMPEDYKWHVDGIMTIILLTTPLIICGYFMNYLKFGEIFR